MLSGMGQSKERDEPTGDREVDPLDFVRAVLHIAPEDAKKVRDASPARKRTGQVGPVHDYDGSNAQEQD